MVATVTIILLRYIKSKEEDDGSVLPISLPLLYVFINDAYSNQNCSYHSDCQFQYVVWFSINNY